MLSCNKSSSFDLHNTTSTARFRVLPIFKNSHKVSPLAGHQQRRWPILVNVTVAIFRHLFAIESRGWNWDEKCTWNRCSFWDENVINIIWKVCVLCTRCARKWNSRRWFRNYQRNCEVEWILCHTNGRRRILAIDNFVTTLETLELFSNNLKINQNQNV